MSSEDKTVEPSDQGPSLPSGSAGATSTGSPAQTDKRPRGRPRKDAATTTIAPQAPPTSKTRKKGRARGRAVVVEEEEDSSMDGTEAATSESPPHDATDAPAQQQVDSVEVVTTEGPGETEEKPHSPHVQSPQTGDAAEPSAAGPATTREAKSSEQLCAFCYCDGRSLLGQGDLRVFDSSPGHERSATGGVGHSSDHRKASQGGGDRTTKPSDSAGEASSGQRDTRNGAESYGELPDPDKASRFWDELAHVGLPGDVDIQSLFEESGQCWAHHRCALWSQGVCVGEGQSLLNVDRSIDSGSTEHCAYCKRLGASIKCCAEGCARLYHYPCAGAAGTFQDIRSLSLLCPDHIELAVIRFPDDFICALCDSPGELPDQLFCTSCGQHYHGACLDMAVTPLRRAGWQCPECKVCQTCKNPGEDDKMLVCDMCDKGYHTFCLQPAIDDIPTNGWRCKNCRVCVQCGTRTSGQWHHTSLLCETCVQHQDPSLSCPLCACILDPEHHKDLLSCHSCKRWLHLECERQSSGHADIQPSQGYVCSSCRPTGSQPQHAPPQVEEEEVVPQKDTGGLELSPQTATQSHTDPEPVVLMHTDLEPGLKQRRSPPPVHNDPEPELQPVPMHTDTEPEPQPKPIQATAAVCENGHEERQPQQATSDQQPGISVGAAAVEQGTDEVSINKDPGELHPEMQPAAETHVPSTKSPESPRLTKQEPEKQPLPAQVSREPEQPQDVTGLTKQEPYKQPLPAQVSREPEQPQDVTGLTKQEPEKQPLPAQVSREPEQPQDVTGLTKQEPEKQPLPAQVSREPEQPQDVTGLTKQEPEKQALPAQVSREPEQPQDVTGLTKTVKTEPTSENRALKPCTEDIMTPPTNTKEPSTASVIIKEEPMEVSASDNSGVEQVEPPSSLETAMKARRERKGEPMSEALAGGALEGACALEEMDTTPETENKPKLSHHSPPIEEKPYKTSMERLAEMAASPTHSSPRTMGPSPREPPLHAHPAPGEHSSSVPSTTLILLTPKIGMGKPAISKRKFSPGRPRVKQGAWHGSPHSSVSSPSWSPDQPEGWNVPKTRQLSSGCGSSAWSIRVGRGSGFPGRRRPRGAGLSGRGGRGRARGKNGASPTVNPGVTTMESPYQVKEEEENAMHNTVVIFSSNDSFTLKQDMCVVCGSFGLGAEGRLLACAQCGQCYHPFCVGIKITKVVLNKGWRCLECTVCEACGQATDPGRLLLCDDCDISYHTYCLDPPLQNVPKDSWKCKWCVSCTQCGATSPGLRCEWQNNYTQCAPCGSLATCPFCLQDYSEGEIVVQCRQCDRWIHSSCQGLHSEEDVEKAADSSFDCTMCRVHKASKAPVSKARESIEPAVMTQILTKAKDMDLVRTYTQDGVCLTESGLCQLKSLTAPASRRRKPKPKLKLKIINQNSVAVLQAPLDLLSEHSRDEDMEDHRDADLSLDCEGKSDSSPEREPAEDESKGADGSKKRKRKPYRPGIGGFMVRQRSRPGQGPGKAKRSLSRKDSSGSVSEPPTGKEEGWGEMLPDTPVDETPHGPDIPEKIKKRYRKKKTKLEEAFPTYLQEAFFGKDLLDKSKQSRQQAVESGLLEEGQAGAGTGPQGDRKHPTTSIMDPSSDPLLSATSASSRPDVPPGPQPSEEPLVDLSEVLNTDADLLRMLGKQTGDSGLDFCPFQVDSSSPPFAGLDIGPLTDRSPARVHSQSGRRTPRTLPDEHLDGIFSPELEMADESILSKLYKIPELEGKDVEDLFTAVLSPSTSHPPQMPQPHGPPGEPGTSLVHPHAGNAMFPRMPMMNGLMGPNQRFPLNPSNPGAGPCIPDNFSPLHRMPFTDNPRDRKFNQMAREAVGPWQGAPGLVHGGPGLTPPPGPGPEGGEAEAMSNAQRSTLKWEKEETLGELATVAPVLYTNVNFPSLKDEFPDWSTRVKQIAKLWRKASSLDRAPYVQKARDNRAALRINKVQMSNESLKRQQSQQIPLSQQPPVSLQLPDEVFDPNIPLDTDLLFKDPLKPKESEHEQEWKFRQQMRQKSRQQAKIEATQKLEQVKNEQLQQQQQQSGSQSEGDGNNSGNQSPSSQHGSNGSMSPMQQSTGGKEGFLRPQLPGTPTSGPPEDVFLRPPPPPPSGGSSQPQSPQVFSPGSSGSRPSSPCDPYAKMVGTPRPPTLGPGASRRMSMESGKSPTSLMDQQDRGRLTSPAHEAFGSPTSMSREMDPYAKPPDTPRPVAADMDPFLKPMGPPRVNQGPQGRPPMSSPVRGDPYSRPMIRQEAYQRMAQNRMILSDPYSRPLLAPIPGSNEQGSVPQSLFKTPMPPPQAQDLFNRSMGHLSDRISQQGDPYSQASLTPRPHDSFTSPPRMAQHHPQGHPFPQPGPIAQLPNRNPYAHAPSTPRPDHFTYDPFAQPPGNPRPSSDPYAQMSGIIQPMNDPSCQLPGNRPFFESSYARPPGTPRPHDNYGQSSDPYSQQPNTPRSGPGMNQFPHPHPQAPGQRMSPGHSMDPYAQQPGTPRPPMGERFSKSPGSQRLAPMDPYASQPGTPRPMSGDMFSQTTRPMLSDPYAQAPGTPRPGLGPDGLGRLQVQRPGPLGNQQDHFSTQGVRPQDAPFSHPGSQTPTHHGGMADDGFSPSPSRRPNQTPVHDPYEQAPTPPCPKPAERLEMKEQQGRDPGGQLQRPSQMPGTSEVQSVSLADSEERLRQRQRIRELILKQQQQRSAIRQENAGNMAPGTPRPWPHEGHGQQCEIFSRPPPPYPGPGPMRFPGPFPGDQRGPFPNEGQLPRGQHPGDPNIRHQGPRFAFPPGGPGPHGGQEFFLRGPHPMQDIHPGMRRSMSVDMAKSVGGNPNPMGLPQHFPPRGLPMQQHNIMGQPFIELRHRAPDSRLRLPFGPNAMDQCPNMDPNLQPQRPPGFMGGPEFRFPPGMNQDGPRMMMGSMGNQQVGQSQLSSSMENLHQQQQAQMQGGTMHRQAQLMRSMSQPASNETQSMSAPSMMTPGPSVGHTDDQGVSMANNHDGVEEKLDTVDSAVKDLEDVEVKDLVDADLDNLNLDPEEEDGKDLDLETNDLHLDDFLTSGKFDIIAYTDPDLNDIKKDMFNEELELSDHMEDHSDASDFQKALSEKRNFNSSCGGAVSSFSNLTSGMGKSEGTAEKYSSSADVKQEVSCRQSAASSLPSKQKIKMVDGDNLSQTSNDRTDQQADGNPNNQSGVLSDSTPVLSSLLIKQQPEDSSPDNQGSGNSMAQPNQDAQNISQTMDPTSRGEGEGETSMSTFEIDQSGLTPAQQALLVQTLGQVGPGGHRPLLLEEQPLLLQDLLDQERQEQQQQRQMQAMIRQRSSSDSFFPNIDFDAITDPIMKAKMVALKGINKVMVQNNMGMTPMVMNRFPPGAAAPCPESASAPPQAVGQDGKLTPAVARPNPPNFGSDFVNNAQKAQYEEWLQETQQLLQMQQKFLEEKIGAHRKAKKALCAKQRTAKKAGREFAEEDAEQLKHVTEQQSVVQKQLEQIRKQQKEHAELIEEYQVKQQQGGSGMPPTVMPATVPGMPPMQGVPGGKVPSRPPMNQQPPMNPMMHQVPLHPGQPNAPPQHMPITNQPGWHPGAPMPMGGPNIPSQIPMGNPAQQPSQMPQQTPIENQPQTQPSGVTTPQGSGLKFDDNNPFSEGFQERERRERLREQQERQRVQLMQEVERQRALKQRMEMEQQGLLGSDGGNMAPISQMPFFNAELPQDFMQPQRPQLPQQQQQLGPMFPQQQSMQSGMGSPPAVYMQGGDRRAMMSNGMLPQDMGPGGFGPDTMGLQGANFSQGPLRPRRFSGPGMMSQIPGEGPPFCGDSSTTPLPSNFPGSGQSLIQLYSNIIPEEKGKKKRNRKKKKDNDDADSIKTPSTPHSDLTAPLTPCRSDTSSTPTRNNAHLFGDQDLSRSPLLGSSTSTHSHSELERQLSAGGLGVGGGQPVGMSSIPSDVARAQALEQERILSNIKLEQTESTECASSDMCSGMGIVKEEGGPAAQSPLHSGGAKGESGGNNELLKHLLKNKQTPFNGPGLPHQRSDESLRSEEEEVATDCKALLLRQSSMDSNGAYSDGQMSGLPEFPGPLLAGQEKKKGRNKRTPKGGERPASRYRKRKKEGEEKQLVHCSTDALMTQLKQQLSLLPLIEPLIGVNFAHFAPYGSGQLNGENHLSGTFGSAALDGVSDYYSQLAYKQNNLSNPPTPPASLPPTPPPVNRQKMINGFATTEELASKAAAMVSKGLVPKPLHVPFRTEEDLLARAIAQGPKTVDVPASLPTPPHNNQEELSNRLGQEHCKDRDTPDSFVPSSSPESVVGMEISRYPNLSLVKQEPRSPCLSPVLPMLPAPWGKGLAVRLKTELKTEPSGMFFGSHFGPASNDAKPGLVSVAITLRPAAAENVTGVVAAISDLLCVKIPSSYEVSSPPGPDRGPLAMLSGLRGGPQGDLEHRRPGAPMIYPGRGGAGDMGGPHPQGAPGQLIRSRGGGGPQQGMMMQQQQGHPQQHIRFHSDGSGPAAVRDAHQKDPGSPGSKPQWCCHCKVVVLGNGVCKSIKDLPVHKQEQEGLLRSEGNLVFCSHSCFLLYSASTSSSSSSQARNTTDTKDSVALLSPDSDQKESLSKAHHQYSNNMSSLDVHCLAQLQPKQSPPSTPPIPFPPASDTPKTPKTDVKSDTIKVTVKLKARGPRAQQEGWHQGKRHKGLRWRKWTVQVVVPRGSSQLPDENQIDELLRKLGASLRPGACLRDQRRCCFCHQLGDGVTDGPARLLNLDLDAWVHLNCALWSTEVYETQAGALINVELALRRGSAVRCAYCQQMGATSGCHRLRCTNIYHFTCALQAHCTFFKDKTMLCHAHRPRGSGSAHGGSGLVLEHELRCFAVFRRVYVQRDEVRQMASAVQQPELGYTFRVGSLVLHAVGQLTPSQMAAFHSTSAIFPVGYEACRIYWSMRHGNRRCRYLCSVEEREEQPEFRVRVVEQGYKDLVLTDSTAKGVWDKVLGPVADKRTEIGTLKLFPVYLKGEDLFGLTVSAVTKITESLPGVEACDRYTFRYGRNPLMELPLIFNPSGSARAMPKTSSPFTAVVIRPQPVSRNTSTTSRCQNTAQGEGGVPYTKPPTVHHRSSQYRWMKSEWRANVYLAASKIQGLGLYAARDIEKNTMVIEYNGTVLRNEVAIKKQRTYKSQNRGVFMFRIDSERVVDASQTGGLARYINHSCAPNCVAEVVTFERGYKIIVTSNRRIEKGEELCFDYQFDCVDGQHKIACHCGTADCRKRIN
ncbi:histone-lysine N-methyltransferase 2C-like [Oncorhynchus clarkii lewisi]|uniref:histone-lysine N-methyltransferase 2C-like n=1 Tax=Oncorhynchus clarkii lewisi TaxID=490388 RepID=UPI0039B9358B